MSIEMPSTADRLQAKIDELEHQHEVDAHLIRGYVSDVDSIFRLRERITGLRLALEQYGLRSHYECDDYYYSCPKALDPSEFNLTGEEECNCGADAHNAAVLAVLEADK